MDSFPLPVFNLIESEDEEDHEVLEVQELKNPRCDHLHKLLAERSLSLPRHNPNGILKKLEAIAEENLLKKDLKETVSTQHYIFTLAQKLLSFVSLCSAVLCLEIQDLLF